MQTAYALDDSLSVSPWLGLVPLRGVSGPRPMWVMCSHVGVSAVVSRVMARATPHVGVMCSYVGLSAVLSRVMAWGEWATLHAPLGAIHVVGYCRCVSDVLVYVSQSHAW